MMKTECRYKVKFYTVAFRSDYDASRHVWQRDDIVSMIVESEQAAQDLISRVCFQGVFETRRDTVIFIPPHSIVRAEYIEECKEAEQWNEGFKKMAEQMERDT